MLTIDPSLQGLQPEGCSGGSDLIRKAILTSADIGESIAADALICGDEAAVLADKAYESMSRREALAKIGITDWTCTGGRLPGARRPSAGSCRPSLAKIGSSVG